MRSKRNTEILDAVQKSFPDGATCKIHNEIWKWGNSSLDKLYVVDESLQDLGGDDGRVIVFSNRQIHSILIFETGTFSSERQIPESQAVKIFRFIESIQTKR